MYTGKVIIVEKDINPNSPTYGQTRERLEDSELCTHWKCEMQKVNTYAYEGVWYEVYADKNPTSPTYGKTITIERGSTIHSILRCTHDVSNSVTTKISLLIAVTR